MSAVGPDPARLRYLLRAAAPDRAATWLLSDGEAYYAPEDPSAFPLEDPVAMLSLWDARASVPLARVGTPTRYLPPFPIRRVFCPAVNFRSHQDESGMPVPTEPYFFLKFASSAVPHGSTVVAPFQAEQLDYEGEIGYVLGRSGRHWDEGAARAAIFGYTPANDLSLRDYQFREQPRFGKNWVMGKAFDSSLPIGPWILPREAAPEGEMTVRTRVNGELRQDGSTRDMIFRPEQLIARLSEVNTLGPGDLVLSGTPSGVAAYRGRRYLRDGDTVEVEVDGVGTLRHGIAFEPRPQKTASGVTGDAVPP